MPHMSEEHCLVFSSILNRKSEEKGCLRCSQSLRRVINKFPQLRRDIQCIHLEKLASFTDSEGMFSTKSALHQLKPEYILQHVLEAEDSQWSTAHLETDLGSSVSNLACSPQISLSSDVTDPGQQLLRHGSTVRKIHSYFSQLESIKCCMHLAGRTAGSQHMRVVHPSSVNIEEGLSKQPQRDAYVSHLGDKDLRAFKHAYLCAAYPVLAAPEPPPCYTPSPINPVTDPSILQSAADAPGSRVMTPYSLHDSGLEESDDLAVIPAESICAHLQQAFNLTEAKFRDYRYLINKTYVKKSAQKEEDRCAELLAEELAGQLAVLENNCHPFYKPQDFMPPSGYRLWRKAEEDHITERLGKFWQLSLPFPCNAQDLIAELHHIHEDYRILLGRLMAYEHQFHQQVEEHGGSVLVSLSSASVRLLREFGLRYGVGEMYRRICHLELAVRNFTPSVGYLQYLVSLVNSIADMFPPSRNQLIIVKTEYEMLQKSLVQLIGQLSKSLEQVKELFPGNKPKGGVDLLIGLLQKVMEARAYLATPRCDPPPLRILLRDVAQVSFFQIYEKCKTLLRTEIKQAKDVLVCPRLLNALIMEMRSEVQDYKTNFETVFSQYFDVTALAARAFYSMLMADVGVLCQMEALRDAAIDLRMLAIVYRLNQLDNDWCAYVSPQDQRWRLMFQPHLDQLGQVLQLHIQDLVLETIGGDAFKMQEVQLASSEGSCSSSPLAGLQSHSFSLTPSVNSAFNSVTSTPRQGSSVTSRRLQHISSDTLNGESTDPSCLDEDAGVDISDDQAALKPPDAHSLTEHTGTEQDFLTFSSFRRACASVPVTFDRPAIVRPISDVRLSRYKEPMTSLHEAEAMEDLRAVPVSSISKQTHATHPEADAETEKPSTLNEATSEESVALFEIESEESFQDHKDIKIHGTLPMNSSSCDSCSDGEFAFPPLEDVTNMDMAESLKKTSQIKDHLKGEKRPASKPSLHSISSTTQMSKWASSVPHESSKKERLVTKPSSEPPQLKANSKSLAVGVDRPTSDQSLLFQSVQSAMVFPTPASQEAVLPVSGSIIDMIVLLQRNLSFGQKLCQTVFPVHFRCLPSSYGLAADTVVLHNTLKTYKVNTYMNVVEGFCKGLCTYADNMLCMDLCGLPGNIATRVVGSKLVTHVVKQQQAGHIWGCRHQLDGLTTCFGFHNRQAKYLCDCYEPITQKMCVRINNVAACMHILDWWDQHTQSGFCDGLEADEATGFQTNDTVSSGGGSCGKSCNKTNGPRSQLLDLAHIHLKSVWTALCRLLAFRMNLFLQDALPQLLNLKPRNVSMAQCLLPVTNFLKTHLNCLSSWLYYQSFQRVTEFLWIYVVQDIEDEARNLAVAKSKNTTAHSLLQALMHLMKFMNNHEKGIAKHLLLAQSENLMIRLQLYTLSTPHLIALNLCLKDMVVADEDVHPDDRTSQYIPVQAIHKMHQDLQSLSKCFSGAQLTCWILQHADLFLSEDEVSLCGGEPKMSVQRAASVAQQMLDQHIILDIDTENLLHSETSSIVTQYPKVTLYTRGQGEIDGSRDSDTPPSPKSSPTGGQGPGIEAEVVLGHDLGACLSPGTAGDSLRSPGEGSCGPAAPAKEKPNPRKSQLPQCGSLEDGFKLHRDGAVPSTESPNKSGCFEPTPSIPTPILVEQLRQQIRETGEANSDRFSSCSVTSLNCFHDSIDIFENSPNRFYFMPAAVSLGFNPPQLPTQTSALPFPGATKAIVKMVNSPETIRLAERCYSLKISSLFILLIIYSRRNLDAMARSFIMGLPAPTVSQFQKHITAASIQCAVL